MIKPKTQKAVAHAQRTLQLFEFDDPFAHILSQKDHQAHFTTFFAARLLTFPNNYLINSLIKLTWAECDRATIND